MRSPYSPLHLLLFLFLLGFLFFYLQVFLVTTIAEKLGLTPLGALLLFGVSLFGSAVNLPLFSLRAEPPAEPIEPRVYGLLRLRPRPFTGRTIVAINLGGALVPIAFSIDLLLHYAIAPLQLVGALGVVTAVSYAMSRPVAGLGIAMPVFVAPVAAALAALIFGGEHAPPLAYVAGVLGVLIGADLLRIGDIRRLGVPMASIGGAGTFDGIFITGIVATLLA